MAHRGHSLVGVRDATSLNFLANGWSDLLSQSKVTSITLGITSPTRRERKKGWKKKREKLGCGASHLTITIIFSWSNSTGSSYGSPKFGLNLHQNLTTTVFLLESLNTAL